MQQIPDDRILWPTRAVAAIVTPILATAGVILVGFPDATEQLWAWPMGPEMTTLAVGGGYLAGATLFARATLARSWHTVGAVFLFATVLTVLLLAATVLHWDAFIHGHVSFWTWLVVYAVTPVLLPTIWLSNRRRDPGRPGTNGALVPRWIRAAVGMIGVVQFTVALTFFAVPWLAIQVWPWQLSALTARTLAAFLAFIGAMWVYFLFEERWSALRLHVESATIGLALVALGALRAPSDLGPGSVPVALFGLLLGGTLLGLVALQLWMRRLARNHVVGDTALAR